MGIVLSTYKNKLSKNLFNTTHRCLHGDGRCGVIPGLVDTSRGSNALSKVHGQCSLPVINNLFVYKIFIIIFDRM